MKTSPLLLLLPLISSFNLVAQELPQQKTEATAEVKRDKEPSEKQAKSWGRDLFCAGELFQKAFEGSLYANEAFEFLRFSLDGKENGPP